MSTKAAEVLDQKLPNSQTATASNRAVAVSMEEQIKTDQEISPAELKYAGHKKMPVTSVCRIVTPQEDTPRGVWPVFRLMVSGVLKRLRIEKY